MTEDWNFVIFVNSMNFTTIHPTSANKNYQGEFWLKTNSNKGEINWRLVNTRPPRSSISRQRARNLIRKLGTNISKKAKDVGEVKFFNNNKLTLTTQSNFSSKQEKYIPQNAKS